MTDAQLLQLVIDNILTGNRQTTAALVRTLVNAVINNKQNIDGKNVASGYLGIDALGNANLSLIKMTGFTSAPGTVAATDTILQAVEKLDGNNILSALYNSFADVGNSSTTETDLIATTVSGGKLASDGDKLHITAGGSFVGHATATRRIKLYFGGTAIFDSGAISTTVTSSWSLNATIIRSTNSKVRYIVTLNANVASSGTYASCGELTGLTLSSDNVVKITGTAAAAGAATNDIVLKLSELNYLKTA